MGFISEEVTARNRARVWTPEMRARVSESLRAYYKSHSDSPETRRKKGKHNLGRKLSPEHCANISEGKKGIPRSPETVEKMRVAATGRRHTPKARAKMSASHKGKRPEAASRWWGERTLEEKREVLRPAHAALADLYKDPEFASEQTRKIMAATGAAPNKLEQSFFELLEDLFPGEWRFVGAGELVLGGKCPDFANVNGQKKLIELYGDFWHRGQDPEERSQHFEQFGFQTLVLWESELSLDTEGVLERLLEFCCVEGLTRS